MLFRSDESLKEFSRVYKMLGIEFDSYAGESFYSDKMPRIVNMLEEKGLLQESQGAHIVEDMILLLLASFNSFKINRRNETHKYKKQTNYCNYSSRNKKSSCCNIYYRIITYGYKFPINLWYKLN